MTKKKGKMARTDENYLKELQDINLERFRKGLDKKPISIRELTRVMPTATSWKSLATELKTKPIKKK